MIILFEKIFIRLAYLIFTKNLPIINVKKLSSFTDYMMIASGTSNRHIQSIGEKVLYDLKSKRIKPLGVEGEESKEWVLIDLGDVVLHLMSAKARTFYDLESLCDPDL